MNDKSKRLTGAAGRPWPLVAWLVLTIAAGCTTVPEAPPEPPAPVRYEEPAAITLLNYYQQIQKYSAQEIAKERSAVAVLPASHIVQMKLAMLHAHPKGSGEVGRALGLVESVLKANDPNAAAVHPLARLLAEHYQERMRSDAQAEKLNQQLKEAQRRADQLQEKLDALADIERSLPARSRMPKAPTGGQR